MGILFLLWVQRGKVKGGQNQINLTDKEQIKKVMGIFGREPSEEQINKFVTSLKKEKEKKNKENKIDKGSKRASSKEE